MLQELFSVQNRLISLLSTDFKRFLYNKINWDNRLIAIVGARGTGKTTMVLQHYLENYNDLEKCLYISADNPLVLKKGIYETVSEYFKLYGNSVIIDEVQKQQNWSIDVKALYDSYPNKKIIISGSSVLNILKEKGDLSRRVVIYNLPCLSFREYLNFKYNKKFETQSFENITTNHISICNKINNEFPRILREFSDYIKFGSYPFFHNHSTEEYFILFNNVLDKVIYEDIPAVSNIKSSSTMKLKKLLGFIASSTVPVFNIETLTRDIEVSKDTLYDFFDLLNRSEILQVVRTDSKNVKVMKKSKILFKSPNIYFIIANELWKHGPEKGNIKESFFAGSIPGKYQLYTSDHVDFKVIDENGVVYEIEVGGRNKVKKQIQEVENAYIFKDDIEIGNGNEIPLFMSGFLY